MDNNLICFYENSTLSERDESVDPSDVGIVSYPLNAWLCLFSWPMSMNEK